MASPGTLKALTLIDALLFVPGAYMAVGAFDIAREGSAVSVAIAAIFLALPVFCIACPLSAWRAHRHGRSSRHVLAFLFVPVVYALFLSAFLAYG